ncbi:hypothetical protein BAUCODRAFT_509162 [Baudoinia panamericana UAMH 10762]|uniref:COP9 signalosome complex subunit 3 N-terminal helical repeats domain-containing protein n=1 Tax=Baudoinia panamericana (strain UAMH 10762) TaxID=717646 RepID=M2N9W7_BAUPA|nr:uncharacterized protein BAUCODRAFT_509162 [Baudoinia panamericana UAMH 10762]EMC95924.1 hypothetical protein BAUCODRAFT_509162 [Baudoinia panamericana UAMH 10762]
MADALSVVLSFPPENVAKLSAKKYEEEVHTYMKRLNQLPPTTWTKAIDKKNLLDFLNPEVNSLPYLATLRAQTDTVGKDRKAIEHLVNQCAVFFATFDPIQVRYLGSQWTELVVWLLDILPKLGISDHSTVTTAMLRLDPTAGTFTSTHLRLLRACLQAGVPSQALPILDKDIYAFPVDQRKEIPDELLSEDVELSNGFITPKSGFTIKLKPEYVLEYYLLGAHIYIGRRNFSRARLFLEYVVLHPSQQQTVSALQVEAYKKWVMVGLLAEGKSYPLPKTHGAGVMKNIRAVAKPYDVLAECFERRDWRKYQAEMDAGTQTWHEDGNLPLVKEASTALIRYRVMDLQKTYATLPVSRVAAYLGFKPEAALQYLLDVISSGHLHASIAPSHDNSAANAVLRFHELTPSMTNLTADNELAAQTKRIEDLATYVRDADRRLQLTKEYVEHQKRQRRTGPDADLADQMDLTWDAPVPGLGEEGDEDIMAS